MPVKEFNSDLLIAATKNSSSTEGFLVFFGTDWCGHCKKFKPAFEELAIASEKREGFTKPTFIYNQVEKGQEYASKLFRVAGYPTLIYILQDKYWTFKGKRQQEEILEFIDKCKSGQNREGKACPSALPSFRESVAEGFEDLYVGIKDHYHNNTVVFFVVVIVILAVLGVCFATCYQMFTDEGEDLVATPSVLSPKKKED